MKSKYPQIQTPWKINPIYCKCGDYKEMHYRESGYCLMDNCDCIRFIKRSKKIKPFNHNEAHNISE